MRPFRLRRKGLASKTGSGDLLVTIEVEVPRELTPEARKAMEEFGYASAWLHPCDVSKDEDIEAAYKVARLQMPNLDVAPNFEAWRLFKRLLVRVNFSRMAEFWHDPAVKGIVAARGEGASDEGDDSANDGEEAEDEDQETGTDDSGNDSEQDETHGRGEERGARADEGDEA